MTAPTWYTATSAKSTLNIAVTDAGLAVAQEQCLRVKGLALSTLTPPSASFAQGVVYQALANKQASQASTEDDFGGGPQPVRLYPLDKKIMSMLIVPSPVTDDADAEIGDNGFVGSLIG
jgi:hypothetical protein